MVEVLVARGESFGREEFEFEFEEDGKKGSEGEVGSAGGVEGLLLFEDNSFRRDEVAEGL